MRFLGWMIILIELVSYGFRSKWTSTPLQLPMAIVDFAFVVSGTALIIADRIRPIIKKGEAANNKVEKVLGK